MAKASRDLGMPEQSVRRAVKIASLSPEAKRAAEKFEVADNQKALLTAGKAQNRPVQREERFWLGG